MPRRILNWKWTALGTCSLFILAAGSCKDDRDERVVNRELPPHLPDDIVSAWKGPGVEVGWVWLTPVDGSIMFRVMEDGKPEYLPAFQVRHWREGHVATLPDPGTAFGLRIDS